MDTTKVHYEVRLSDGLILFRCLQDMSPAQLRDYLVFAFDYEPAAYSYDWLLDFSHISEALSAEGVREIGRVWQRMARGRDVGKRTAYVTRDPSMRDALLAPRSLLQYRTICVFENFDEAHSWLTALIDNRQDRGVQGI